MPFILAGSDGDLLTKGENKMSLKDLFNWGADKKAAEEPAAACGAAEPAAACGAAEPAAACGAAEEPAAACGAAEPAAACGAAE